MTETERDAVLAEIGQQQRALVLARFTADDAWRLGTILVDLARGRGLPVTVRITRGSQILFHAAMEGTSADNDGWVERKSRTVSRWGDSSMLVGLMHEKFGVAFDQQPWIDASRFSGNGGSFPITVRNAGVIGSVTVSGLSSEDDHALAVEGLGLLRSEQA